jgi:deoxyribonuclease (pyrimidine dimer)
MTRINLVPPSELCDQHLLAEWREAPRVFALAGRAHQPRVTSSHYTLGPGHVTFFYTRLDFVEKRLALLRLEMLRRGFRPTTYPPFTHTCQSGWTPTEAEIDLSRSRIIQRLPLKPRWPKFIFPSPFTPSENDPHIA